MKRFLYVAMLMLWMSTWARPDQALYLDGAGAYLELPDQQRLKPSSAITVMFWAYSDRWTDHSPEQGLTSNLEYGGFSIRLRLNALTATVMRNGYRTVATGSRQLLPGWHHLAMVYDGLSLLLYVDGQIKAHEQFDERMPLVYPNEPLPILIGAELEQGSQPSKRSFFSGRIDDYRIYDEALDAHDILQISSGSSIPTVPLARFSFDGCPERCSDVVSGMASVRHGGVEFGPSFSRGLEIPFAMQFWLPLIISFFHLLLLVSSSLAYGQYNRQYNRSAMILLFAILVLFTLVSLGEATLLQAIPTGWTALHLALPAGLAYAFLMLLLGHYNQERQTIYQFGAFLVAVTGFIALEAGHQYLIVLWALQITIICALLFLSAERNAGFRDPQIWIVMVITAGWIMAWLQHHNAAGLRPFSIPLVNLTIGVLVIYWFNTTKRPGSAWDFLTSREREVGALILQGLNDREIAETLFISFNTARTHVRKVYAKLKVSSRMDAIATLKKMGKGS